MLIQAMVIVVALAVGLQYTNFDFEIKKKGVLKYVEMGYFTYFRTTDRYQSSSSVGVWTFLFVVLLSGSGRHVFFRL